MTNRLSKIEYARLRRQMSDEYETTMWQLLRNRQRCGMKFRREHPVGTYTTDFCCTEVKLVVEIDGSSHQTEEAAQYDRRRDEWMRSQGYEVLRFTCGEVMEQTERVLDSIDKTLCARADQPLTPDPSPQRGEGSEKIS